MALPHSIHPLDYPARFQFQPGAPCNGSSACTDTCIQMVVEYFKEKTYSLGYIRKVAQAHTSFNENSCTGINYVEVLAALNALGVHNYKVAWNVDANFVYNKIATGPVMIGVYYGNYPVNTSGRCGRTNKAELNGKTDCGFRGAHMVLGVARHLHKKGKVTLHRDVYVRDPDHHSSTRPEKPNYDRISITQLDRTIKALPPNTAFKSTYCIYPTSKKHL